MDAEGVMRGFMEFNISIKQKIIITLLRDDFAAANSATCKLESFI